MIRIDKASDYLKKIERKLSGKPAGVSPSAPDAADVPIILISSCKNEKENGDAKFNGGVKLYNLWVKLLRNHGYPAFIVTYDGQRQEWLLEHQPVISLETARRWKSAGLPLKFVTGWLDSGTYIDLADEIYFMDCEITYSMGAHRTLLEKLIKTKIRRTGTISRTQQAWYMATFNIAPELIQSWSDETYWKPSPDSRKENRIGYMKESENTETDIRAIRDYCSAPDLTPEFIRVKGDEKEVRAQMQSLDIFLSMNPGKHPMWGEGSPRSAEEAMHAGAVVVAYDVKGNREYLFHGYNGFLCPSGQPQIMASLIVTLLKNRKLKEEIRTASTAFIQKAFTSAWRWPAVREFLELPELDVSERDPEFAVLTKAQIEERMKAPAYIGEDEIAVFAKRAAQAANTAVEIGAGYGASALLMLLHTQESALVHSIDSFGGDSMSDFKNNAGATRRNVARALNACGRARELPRWLIHIAPSEEAVRKWNQRIDFLYIDGDHRYEAVSQDYRWWAPHVNPGGTIILHDSRREEGAPEGVFARGWPGPTKLAQELREHSCVELIEEVFSMTVWRRSSAECKLCSGQRA